MTNCMYENVSLIFQAAGLVLSMLILREFKTANAKS